MSDNVLDLMKPGDILLFQGRGKLSRLIRWGTGSKYSHVAICVSPKMYLAIESHTRGGVRARDLRKIEDPYDIYRIKETDSYNLDGVVSFLVSRLNAGYDFFGVFWLAIIKLLRKMGIKILENISNEWQRSRDYFCSELCYEAFYNGGGLDIVPNIPEASITSPGDISKSPLIELVKKNVG